MVKLIRAYHKQVLTISANDQWYKKNAFGRKYEKPGLSNPAFYYSAYFLNLLFYRVLMSRSVKPLFLHP